MVPPTVIDAAATTSSAAGMLLLRSASLGLVVLCSLACPQGVTEICGQSTELPVVDDGFGEATRSDGEAFREAGTWAPAPASSITIGTLDMIIANDEAGVVVDDLIADGAFPICVLQGARSETSGQANLVEGGFVTDATHTGGVAILGKEGDTLIGRFSFDLVAGGTELSFSDGTFSVPQR
jgi:hypothetical protein